MEKEKPPTLVEEWFGKEHAAAIEMRPVERVLKREVELEPSEGRELLRAIDRRSAEDANNRSFALGRPPPGWRYDPRYG